MTGQTPIDAARARLHAALRAGEDTAPHRAAIAKLEERARVTGAREGAKAETIAAGRAAAVRTRAADIADEVRGRVDATLAKFPLPPGPQEIDRDH